MWTPYDPSIYPQLEDCYRNYRDGTGSGTARYGSHREIRFDEMVQVNRMSQSRRVIRRRGGDSISSDDVDSRHCGEFPP